MGLDFADRLSRTFYGELVVRVISHPWGASKINKGTLRGAEK
jgi:hypothetical protein